MSDFNPRVPIRLSDIDNLLQESIFETENGAKLVEYLKKKRGAGGGRMRLHNIFEQVGATVQRPNFNFDIDSSDPTPLPATPEPNNGPNDSDAVEDPSSLPAPPPAERATSNENKGEMVGRPPTPTEGSNIPMLILNDIGSLKGVTNLAPKSPGPGVSLSRQVLINQYQRTNAAKCEVLRQLASSTPKPDANGMHSRISTFTTSISPISEGVSPLGHEVMQQLESPLLAPPPLSSRNREMQSSPTPILASNLQPIAVPQQVLVPSSQPVPVPQQVLAPCSQAVPVPQEILAPCSQSVPLAQQSTPKKVIVIRTPLVPVPSSHDVVIPETPSPVKEHSESPKVAHPTHVLPRRLSTTFKQMEENVHDHTNGNITSDDSESEHEPLQVADDNAVSMSNPSANNSVFRKSILKDRDTSLRSRHSFRVSFSQQLVQEREISPAPSIPEAYSSGSDDSSNESELDEDEYEVVDEVYSDESQEYEPEYETQDYEDHENRNEDSRIRENHVRQIHGRSESPLINVVDEEPVQWYESRTPRQEDIHKGKSLLPPTTAKNKTNHQLVDIITDWDDEEEDETEPESGSLQDEISETQDTDEIPETQTQRLQNTNRNAMDISSSNMEESADRLIELPPPLNSFLGFPEDSIHASPSRPYTPPSQFTDSARRRFLRENDNALISRLQNELPTSQESSESPEKVSETLVEIAQSFRDQPPLTAASRDEITSKTIVPPKKGKKTVDPATTNYFKTLEETFAKPKVPRIQKKLPATGQKRKLYAAIASSCDDSLQENTNSDVATKQTVPKLRGLNVVLLRLRLEDILGEEIIEAAEKQPALGRKYKLRPNKGAAVGKHDKQAEEGEQMPQPEGMEQDYRNEEMLENAQNKDALGETHKLRPTKVYSKETHDKPAKEVEQRGQYDVPEEDIRKEEDVDTAQNQLTSDGNLRLRSKKAVVKDKPDKPSEERELRVQLPGQDDRNEKVVDAASSQPVLDGIQRLRPKKAIAKDKLYEQAEEVEQRDQVKEPGGDNRKGNAVDTAQTQPASEGNQKLRPKKAAAKDKPDKQVEEEEEHVSDGNQRLRPKRVVAKDKPDKQAEQPEERAQVQEPLDDNQKGKAVDTLQTQSAPDGNLKLRPKKVVAKKKPDKQTKEGQERAQLEEPDQDNRKEKVIDTGQNQPAISVKQKLRPKKADVKDKHDKSPEEDEQRAHENEQGEGDKETDQQDLVPESLLKHHDKNNKINGISKKILAVSERIETVQPIEAEQEEVIEESGRQKRPGKGKGINAPPEKQTVVAERTEQHEQNGERKDESVEQDVLSLNHKKKHPTNSKERQTKVRIFEEKTVELPEEQESEGCLELEAIRGTEQDEPEVASMNCSSIILDTEDGGNNVSVIPEESESRDDAADGAIEPEGAPAKVIANKGVTIAKEAKTKPQKDRPDTKKASKAMPKSKKNCHSEKGADRLEKQSKQAEDSTSEHNVSGTGEEKDRSIGSEPAQEEALQLRLDEQSNERLSPRQRRDRKKGTTSEAASRRTAESLRSKRLSSADGPTTTTSTNQQNVVQNTVDGSKSIMKRNRGRPRKTPAGDDLARPKRTNKRHLPEEISTEESSQHTQSTTAELQTSDKFPEAVKHPPSLPLKKRKERYSKDGDEQEGTGLNSTVDLPSLEQVGGDGANNTLDGECISDVDTSLVVPMDHQPTVEKRPTRQTIKKIRDHLEKHTIERSEKKNGKQVTYPDRESDATWMHFNKKKMKDQANEMRRRLDSRQCNDEEETVRRSGRTCRIAKSVLMTNPLVTSEFDRPNYRPVSVEEILRAEKLAKEIKQKEKSKHRRPTCRKPTNVADANCETANRKRANDAPAHEDTSKRNRLEDMPAGCSYSSLPAGTDSNSGSVSAENLVQEKRQAQSWMMKLMADSGTRVAQMPIIPAESVHFTLDHLNFTERNGIHYSFYMYSGNGNYGFLRFSPRSVKKLTKTSTFTLKFLILHGLLNFEINDKQVVTKGGDFLMIPESSKYSIENGDEVSLIFMIKC